MRICAAAPARRAPPSRRGRPSLGHIRRAALAFCLCWPAVPSAQAQISGSVSIVSDERWRGRSLSAGQPAATVALSYDHPSGFYVDGSATGAVIDDHVDLIGVAADAGYAWRLSGGTSLDVGVTHRAFTRYYSGGRSTGYSEVYAGISGRSLAARVHYSPNYLRRGWDTVYGTVEGVVRPAPRWRLLGQVGALAYLGGTPVRGLRPVQYNYSLGVARQQGAVELRLTWSNGGPDRDYYDRQPHTKSALVASATFGF